MGLLIAATSSGGSSPTTPDAGIGGGSIDAASSDDPDELGTFVDGLLDEVVGVDVPGASVAIVRGDEVVLAEGYGVADATTNEPVSAENTAFNVGSIAKLVTFTAVMQGVEDGTLDLDADVATYLDASAADLSHDAFPPITLRHLGTHTAGFETVPNPGLVQNPDAVPSLDEAVSAQDRPERVRPPGAMVNYSNYGTMLAGYIVERTQELSFDDYVRERIFAPLGMSRAGFEQPVPDERPGTLTASHAGGEGEFERVEPFHIGWRPAGALSASATDMAAFMSAHLGDGAHGDARILQPETLATMHELHHDRHPAVAGLRYGFFEHHRDTDVIRHDGSTIHDTAELLLAPDQDLGVFVAFNIDSDAASPIALADQITEHLGGFSEGSDPEPTDARAASERAEQLAGEYRPTLGIGPGLIPLQGVSATLTVTSNDDGSITAGTLEFEDRYVESEPYVFHQVDGPEVIAVEVEGDQVTMLHLSSFVPTTFLPVPATERIQVLAVLLLGPLLIFLVSLLGLGLVGVRRRWRARTATSGQEASGDGSAIAATGAARVRWRDAGTLTRASGVVLGLAAWGWVLALGWAFTDGDAVFLEPLPVQLVFALPYLIAAAALVTAIGAIVAWRRRLGTVSRRVHHSVLAMAGMLMLWPLAVVGLL